MKKSMGGRDLPARLPICIERILPPTGFESMGLVALGLSTAWT
jgi:hypothetical protein